MTPWPASVRTRRAIAIFAAGLAVFGAALMVRLLMELAAPPGAGEHHDILAFWAAGKLILDGRPDALYDASAVTTIQRTVIPHPIGMNGYMPFINPPIAAAIFAPLAALPLSLARMVWAAGNLAVAVGAAWWIGRDLPTGQRLAAVVLIATSFPVYHALAEGQWSLLLLAAALVTLAAARRNREVLAGAALATLWLKPQFIVLPLVGLAIGRRWRIIVAALITGAVLALAGLPLTGIAAYGTYGVYLVGVVMSHFSGAGANASSIWQGDLATTEGLNGLLVGWFGQGSVLVVNLLWATGLAGLAITYGRAVRGLRPGFDTPAGRLLLTAGVVLVVLSNPNLFVQDCVLVFLVLEALRPLPVSVRFPAVVLAAAVADLTFVDLQFSWLHAFPIVLVAAFMIAIKSARTNASRLSLALATG